MALSKYDIELDLAANPETSHAFIVDMVGSNKRVLDVGCDTGYLGESLIALGCRVWGVEVNPETARVAAEKLERVLVGDLETLDLPAEFGEGAFDVVVFGDVLEHLRDPLPVLRQARRLLAPGGSVVISTPNIAHGDIRLALLAGRFRYTRLGILDETHTRFFTAESLAAFLRDGGFELIELRRTFAPLFGTEQELDRADFPAEVIASLENDVEARTYQFVARAALEGADTQAAAIALELDRARAEISRLEGESAELSAALEQARGDLADATAALEVAQALASKQHNEELSERAELAGTIEGMRAEADAAQAQAQALRAELDAARRLIRDFEQTRAVRAARLMRRVAPGKARDSGEADGR